MLIIESTPGANVDRTELFKEFAQQRAQGTVFTPPALLPPEERRLHVRQTLREDHQFRINNRPEGAQAKFDKLAGSPFSFFRGTALLYYRDHAGIDGHLPTVFTVGDVHPENFGVMPNEDGAPIFGVNDFDEAYFAPFSWDVRRGALGFNVVARESGLSRKKRRKVVKAFVKGYVAGLTEFARDDREKWHEYRIDNSPEMIKDLLESALESRKDFLEEKIDLDKETFFSTDEIVPHSRYIEQFQEVIDDYRGQNDIPVNTRAGYFKVKDVAIKKDSGTASLGLDRFWVLIEGATDDVTDDLLLELKQTRRSALYGLVPENGQESDEGGKAGRVAKAQHIHLVGGDPYYGEAQVDGRSFLVRERSPYKDDIDVDDLSKKELKRYARICGKTLSQTHARSDEDTGIMDGDAEKQILRSINSRVFIADMVRSAEVSAKRLYADHELFREDHALGAFDLVSSE